MKKNLGILVAIVTIVAGIFTIAAYFKSGEPSVRADNHSYAAGRDVRVEGDKVISQFDFDAQQREEALRWVRVSREACAEMKRKTEGITIDTSMPVTDMLHLVPMQMYPSEIVARQFGENVHQTVTGKLQAVSTGHMEMMKPLFGNLVPAASGSRRSARLESLKAGFPAARERQLVAIDDLCAYLGRLGA
jgi:hypothetical protein